MQLYFAKPFTFDYWVQSYFAGCVHPDELTEAIARDAYKAGALPLRARIEALEGLLRDVRGTLRTDQYDGHRRIARKIDDALAKVAPC